VPSNFRNSVTFFFLHYTLISYVTMKFQHNFDVLFFGIRFCLFVISFSFLLTRSHLSVTRLLSAEYSQCASATLCNGMVLHSLRLFPSAPSLHQNIRLLLFGWSQLFVACEFGTPSLIRRGTLDVRLRRDNVVFEKSTRYDAVFGSFQSC